MALARRDRLPSYGTGMALARRDHLPYARVSYGRLPPCGAGLS
jgi:hypothetical protein